jgi:hypothetical protein
MIDHQCKTSSRWFDDCLHFPRRVSYLPIVVQKAALRHHPVQHDSSATNTIYNTYIMIRHDSAHHDTSWYIMIPNDLSWYIVIRGNITWNIIYYDHWFHSGWWFFITGILHPSYLRIPTGYRVDGRRSRHFPEGHSTSARIVGVIDPLSVFCQIHREHFQFHRQIFYEKTHRFYLVTNKEGRK